MANGRADKYRTLTLLLLVAIIVAGAIMVWSRSGRGHSIEISLTPVSELKGEVYVGGAVINPGIYPLKDGDTVEDVIRFAGGATASADPGRVDLNVPEGGGEQQPPQKVNINRAEEWLLEALPGVGKTLAQRIVDYRKRNGPFRSTSDLMRVEGFGASVYQRIEGLITVVE